VTRIASSERADAAMTASGSVMDTSFLISMIFFCNGIGEGDAPGEVQQVSCLDQILRRMTFPAKKFDPGNNGNVK
jgi:hypothetical protein